MNSCSCGTTTSAPMQWSLRQTRINLTTRDLRNPYCRRSLRSCHSLIDPIGLGFEHFDAVIIGEMKNGQSVDARENYWGPPMRIPNSMESTSCP